MGMASLPERSDRTRRNQPWKVAVLPTLIPAANLTFMYMATIEKTAITSSLTRAPGPMVSQKTISHTEEGDRAEPADENSFLRVPICRSTECRGCSRTVDLVQIRRDKAWVINGNIGMAEAVGSLRYSDQGNCQ